MLSAYAVVGEGSGAESIFSSCFLVAHAFNKPKKLVFLLLEPVLPTLWADVHTSQNFPWSFKFARVASDAGRQRLHFIIDMHFFVDVATKAARLAVDQVECQELKFQVSGLDSLLVESAVMPLGLMNPIFDELHELDSTGTSRLGLCDVQSRSLLDVLERFSDCTVAVFIVETRKLKVFKAFDKSLGFVCL